MFGRRRLQWRVSVPVSCGSVLVLGRVLRVSTHLFVCCGEGRTIVLAIDVVNHGALRRIAHRERVSPVLVVFHPRLRTDARLKVRIRGAIRSDSGKTRIGHPSPSIGHGALHGRSLIVGVHRLWRIVARIGWGLAGGGHLRRSEAALLLGLAPLFSQLLEL